MKSLMSFHSCVDVFPFETWSCNKACPYFFNTQYSLQIESLKWNLYLSEAGGIRERDIPILESIWLDKNV